VSISNARSPIHCVTVTSPHVRGKAQIKIKIHLFKQKSGHTGPEDTDACPTTEDSTTTKHTGLSELHPHGVKSTNLYSSCLNTEMILALIISLDKLFQISISRGKQNYTSAHQDYTLRLKQFQIMSSSNILVGHYAKQKKSAGFALL